MPSELNARQYLLLRVLDESVAPMKSAALCSLLDISPRTLRYEISHIARCAGAPVIKSGKNGYFIDRSPEAERFLASARVEQGTDLAKRLTVELLAGGSVNVYDLEQRCYASASTITDQLAAVNAEMERFGLRACRQGDTLHVTGRERDIRKMLSSLLLTEVSTLANAAHELDGYFSRIRVDDVHALVVKAFEESGVETNSFYLNNIVASVAVALERIVTEHLIVDGTHPGDAVGEASDPALHERFLAALEQAIAQRYRLALSPEERAHLRLVISGFIRGENEPAIDEEFRRRVRRCLDDTLARYRLAIDYEPFFERFALHVHYLIARARGGGWTGSEMVDPIRNSHPLLWELSVYLGMRIEDEFGVEIPQDELAFLALYIGFSVGDTVSYGQCRAVCICPRYNALRETLVDQLSTRFAGQVQIVGIYDSVTEIGATEYDIVISTRRNELIVNDAVYVSPIITPREMHAIDKQIMRVFKKNRASKIRRDLIDLFDPKCFFYRAEPLDAHEALHLQSAAMERAGIVDEAFAESVREREELASTAFFQRFAIPHALEPCAHRTAISYLYSERGIEWNGEQVHLVLLLASKADDASFADTYSLLFDILTDTALYQELVRSRTYEELIAFLSSAAL